MIFNNKMDEAFSDNSHYEKCLETLESHDVPHNNFLAKKEFTIVKDFSKVDFAGKSESSKMISNFKKRNSFAVRLKGMHQDKRAMGFISKFSLIFHDFI